MENNKVIRKVIRVEKASNFDLDRDLTISVITIYPFDKFEQGVSLGIKNEHIDTLIAKLIEYKKDNNL